MTTSNGSDVPKPNTDGRIKPLGVSKTTGINVSLNSTNIVGQKANVKITPSKSYPSNYLLIY